MKTRENHFMVDIETTGVNRDSDKILQIGMVEIEHKEDGYWHPIQGRELDFTLHYPGQPANEFAKKHMSKLYEKCNKVLPDVGYNWASCEIREFIHKLNRGTGNMPSTEKQDPKFFMGWNASNFDLPFLFDAKILTPSYYESDPVTGKETLRGDAHYRIYEQTGSVQLVCDATGLDRKTIETLAMDLNPTGIVLPKGKEHDALYDCYKQIIMQNGLIKISRMGIRK